jgi:hypothetical protein
LIDPIAHLGEVVTFPLGECSALVGDRGTHKSHLAYLVLLSRIVKGKHRGLVVSLRDGETLTRQMMNGILTEQIASRRPGNTVEQYEADGSLEIMYYPPGYITPEEFFHRLLLSINRLAQNESHVTLVFNSLDQLSSRFPLCAREDIFIPGIVQMLSASGVISIFVAAADEGRDAQRPEYYTLMSIAEVLASMRREETPREAYCSLVEKWYRDGKKLPLAVTRKLRDKHTAVARSVDRFAGGRPAGARGLLELIPAACDDDDPLYLAYGRR